MALVNPKVTIKDSKLEKVRSVWSEHYGTKDANGVTIPMTDLELQTSLAQFASESITARYRYLKKEQADTADNDITN